MMDVEERVFVVTFKIKGMKCEKIGDSFERKFHKKSPTDKAIRELLTKFQRTGSVLDDSRNGRPRKSGKEWNWFEKHLKRIRNYQIVGHLTC